jgi:hypothetical protein
MRIRHGVLPGAALLALAACADSSAPSGISLAMLSGAFATAPAGYGDLSSSYIGLGADRAAGGDSLGFPGGGRGRGMGHGDMMGGGLGDAFVGGIGMGRGRGHEGPFGGGLGCAGSYDAATGRVACAEATLRNGLVVARSAAYRDAAGNAQQAFDSLTTNSVNLRSSVAGTVAFTNPDPLSGRRGPGGHRGPRGELAVADAEIAEIAAHRGPGGPGGPAGPGHGVGFRLLGDTSRILGASITIRSSSERTTRGLASGSTQRTVDGVSSGSETTTGASTRGRFTATRTAADTTSGIVIPVAGDRRAYPTAGRVVRTMSITLAYEGATPVSLARREVVTYDGSATAQVSITENGETRRCTRALPRGVLVCP